jgi:ribosomal protein L11 methyltransferase
MNPPEPRYPYVHVDVTPEQAELLGAELFELGAQGLEERDDSTLLHAEGGAARVTLVASFADEESAQAAVAALAGRHAARIEHVVGDGWRDGWRAYFKPMRVGKRLVVKPSWEPYAKGAGDVVLTLDPGQAFGTGTHESTQLLLAEVEERVTAGMRVLDVGAGSGILGIAALLFGASSVQAIDVDSLAVDASRENAEANGVGDKLHASTTPVQDVTEQFPLVFGNIEARVLIPLAAELARCVEAGGLLLLSGLLHEHADPVRAAYPGFVELSRPTRGDWCALVLRKAAHG